MSMIQNLLRLRNFKGTYPEKISLFFSLTMLDRKSRLFNKPTNNFVHQWFLKYKVFSYKYSNLRYLFNEIFISNDYYFESITKSPLIVDCGANIGMSVLYFKRLFPDSKIIVFEPNPYAFALLKRNMEINNIENLELHNVALSDKETEISFYIDDNRGTLGGSVNKVRGGSNELKVPAKTLSGYLKNISAADLIKIDVEGAESNLLTDLVESGMINKGKEYIIEYHHNMNGEKSRLSYFLEVFEAQGFNYNIRTTYKKVNSFQDILLHFYKK